MSNNLLNKPKKHLSPSFRRKPESSVLLLSIFIIFWTPAPAYNMPGQAPTGVTMHFSTIN